MVVLSMILTSRQIRSTPFWSALARQRFGLVPRHTSLGVEMEQRQVASLAKAAPGRRTPKMSPFVQRVNYELLWSALARQRFGLVPRHTSLGVEMEQRQVASLAKAAPGRRTPKRSPLVQRVN